MWDNRGVAAAKAIPRRLLVLDGGVVGAEKPFAGEELAAALADGGIRVFTGVSTVRATRPGADGPVTLVLADGTELTGDELLVAAGRGASTDDISLETVGPLPTPSRKPCPGARWSRGRRPSGWIES